MTDLQTDLAQELRAYIAETFLDGGDSSALGDDDQLLELGVIDSLGFIELVEVVQTRYGVVVEDIEITEENFGSISALVAFVHGKRVT
jgi:acyl carrier protein